MQINFCGNFLFYLFYLFMQPKNDAVHLAEDNTYCHYSNLPSPLAYVINQEKIKPPVFNLIDIDRIIEMAWEDKTPFDAIEYQFDINEAAVKVLMKKSLKLSSYKLWRRRVHNCSTKHKAKRSNNITRFKCSLQKTISHNKISKK